MNRYSLVLLALLATAGLPAVAADHTHAGHMHGADAALADGVVKKVDKAGGKLTVSHGPLPNGMPAMTMPFKVKDAAWLDQLKAGDKIRFHTVETGGVSTIDQLEPAK